MTGRRSNASQDATQRRHLPKASLVEPSFGGGFQHWGHADPLSAPKYGARPLATGNWWLVCMMADAVWYSGDEVIYGEFEAIAHDIGELTRSTVVAVFCSNTMPCCD